MTVDLYGNDDWLDCHGALARPYNDNGLEWRPHCYDKAFALPIQRQCVLSRRREARQERKLCELGVSVRVRDTLRLGISSVHHLIDFHLDKSCKRVKPVL